MTSYLVYFPFLPDSPPSEVQNFLVHMLAPPLSSVQAHWAKRSGAESCENQGPNPFPFKLSLQTTSGDSYAKVPVMD